MSRVGVRVQDLFDEKILRQKVEGALELKNHLLVKVYNRRAITVDEVVEEFLAYADRLRPMVADTALVLGEALDARQDRAARGRPGDAARRRPRHLSVRHVVQPDRRRRVHRARASRRPASTGSSPSSRPTRRASARGRSRPSCSTTTARSCAPTAASSAPRPAVRAAAAGTTPSSRGTPRASTASPTSSSPSSTCSTGWERIPVCVALRRRRQAPRRDADDADRLPPREAGLRVLRRLGRGHHRRPRRSRTCRRPRRRTSRRSRTCPARRSARSASAPAGTRPSRSARCSAEPCCPSCPPRHGPSSGELGRPAAPGCARRRGGALRRDRRRAGVGGGLRRRARGPAHRRRGDGGRWLEAPSPRVAVRSVRRTSSGWSPTLTSGRPARSWGRAAWASGTW